MPKEDSAIDPKPTISLMFAISVGFWASQLATYITPTSESARLRTEAEGLQAWVNTKVNRHVEKDLKVKNDSDSQSEIIRRIQRDMQSDIRGILKEYIDDPDGFMRSSAEVRQKQQEGTLIEIIFAPFLRDRPESKESDRPESKESERPEEKLKSDIKDHLDSYVQKVESVNEDLYEKADDFKDRVIDKLKKYVNRISPTNRKWKWWLTLGSGLFFLIDLLCIVWWYARYIYRVQPKAHFWTYFLDFVICSMFALAANSWTKPSTFLFASLCGSTFLIFRFALLYFGSSASQTDRYILKMAGIGLSFAILVVLAFLFGVDKVLRIRESRIYIFKPSLPGLLSLIGIVLTICLKTKIDVAVAIYAARYAPRTTAHLVWPKSMLPEKKNDTARKEQHARIRHRAQNGLDDFDNLFRLFKKHDRIYSRVHSETELRVQSYILSLPSCEKEDYAEEIEKKAFMVAVSHWLDDLVDGRNELFVYEQLQRYKQLYSDPPLSDEKKCAKDLFLKIYRPLITKYTDRHFYDRLYDKICESCLLPFNQKYMLLGLNRVACGAVIFSPKLTPERRWSVLNDHNNFLKLWNIEGPGKKFENVVEDLIDEISVGDEAGPVLLGLTTKTVQEIAFSSERHELNIGLSILLSILYAPLIYYHDIIEELKNDEMVQLQAFDTDSDLWIPWLERASEIIREFGQEKNERVGKKIDERYQMRLKQIEMAYKCFEPNLKFSKPIKSKLEEIYIPKKKKTKKLKSENLLDNTNNIKEN